MMLHLIKSNATENGRQQIATRIIFFIAGLGMAAWAPIIPFVKLRLEIDERMLGLMLFCIGAGSMAIMPFAGYLLGRMGCRKVLLSAGALLCFDLPMLTFIDTPWFMGAALCVFGAINGIMDVAMNTQAIIVERKSGKSKLSGFHSFYSIGSISGAGCVSLMLLLGMAPTLAISLVCVIIAALLVISARNLLAYHNIDKKTQGSFRLALSNNRVLFIAVLCFFIFMTEGAILDWSALFLNTERGVIKSLAGMGFTVYAVAVACSRLYGDRLIHIIGRFHTLLFSSLCASAGLLLMVTFNLVWVAFIGLILLGLGIANIVPVLFHVAGNQNAVPPNQALSAVTLVGYAGLLTGPALIGFITHYTSLTFSLGCTLFCLLLVSVSARRVMRASH